MLKKLFIFFIVFLIAGCESNIEGPQNNQPILEDALPEVTQPVNEKPEEETVTETVIEEITTPVRIAIMGRNMPSGSFLKFQNELESKVDWYSLPDNNKILDYETVYYFFTELDIPGLNELGFELPELKPYQMFQQLIDETNIIWVNFSLKEKSTEAINQFFLEYQDLDDEIITLVETELPELPESTTLSASSICEVPHDTRLRNDYWEMIMGFPRPVRRLPKDRNATALVLFVDFPNYPATRSIDSLNQFFENRYVKMTNDYIRTMSYGTVEHEFYYHDAVISMPLNVEEYLLSNQVRQSNSNVKQGVDYTELFVREALEVADPTVDFSGYDYVIFHVDTSLPISLADFAWANMARENRGYFTEEKVFYNVNAWSAEIMRPNHEWVGIHEIIHLYGLPDYYSRVDNVWGGDAFVGTFDLMSRAMGKNNELLLWSRWFIGWVSENEIDCIDAREPLQESIHTLQNTMGSNDQKGVLIRLSEHELLLIERKEYSDYCGSCRGGLIVTLYDSSIPAMYGPLRIVRPEGSTNVDFEDAFIDKGDIMETNGVRISVLETSLTETRIQIDTIS
jgi:M6 family metalloprotease-like protein